MLQIEHQEGREAGMTGGGVPQGQAAGRDALLAAYEKGERDFKGWNLDHEDLSGCDLSGSDLDGASLVETVLNGANLRGVIFTRANLTGASLSRCDLSRSDLGWADFSNASLIGADMRKCVARAANFSNALMLRTRLNDADCLGAIFVHVNATAAILESANLECADLSQATMMNASLCGANCAWANMASARLNWANLSWCQLDAADLKDANLTGTVMRAASLTYADLSGAVFTGADLYFADLSGAVVPASALSAARVSSVRLNHETHQRSNWTKEDLRDWQQKGAVIIDLESMPRDVQSFIRQGECSLKIFFSIPMDSDCQVALDALIQHLFGHQGTLRILSMGVEKRRNCVAFYAENPDEVDTLVSCLQTRSWQRNAAHIESVLTASSLPSKQSPPDVLKTLGRLSDGILQIQALMPISREDQTRRYKEMLSPDSAAEGRTPISWSSITLPKVSR